MTWRSLPSVVLNFSVREAKRSPKPSKCTQKAAKTRPMKAKGTPRGAKEAQRDAKGRQREAKMSPEGRQGEPEAKGRPSEANGRPRGGQERAKAPKAAQRPKKGTGDLFFEYHFTPKMRARCTPAAPSSWPNRSIFLLHRPPPIATQNKPQMHPNRTSCERGAVTVREYGHDRTDGA